MAQWSVAEVAAYLSVKPSTVRAYLARGYAPEPDGRLGGKPWWWSETIHEWKRPGRGARTDLEADRIEET